MKALYTGFAVLMLLLITHNTSAATQDPAATKYEYRSGDVNVTGFGKNTNEARSAASEECFEQRMDAFQNQRGRVPAEDQAMMIIDSCVNI